MNRRIVIIGIIVAATLAFLSVGFAAWGIINKEEASGNFTSYNIIDLEDTADTSINAFSYRSTGFSGANQYITSFSIILDLKQKSEPYNVTLELFDEDSFLSNVSSTYTYGGDTVNGNKRITINNINSNREITITYTITTQSSDWSETGPVYLALDANKYLYLKASAVSTNGVWNISKRIDLVTTLQNLILVSIPNPDTTVFTYNGITQTYNITNNVGYTISNNTRINAGTQTVIVSLNDGYQWEDNSFEDKAYAFTINPKNISELLFSEVSAVTYDGTNQVPPVSIYYDTSLLDLNTETTISRIDSNNKNAGINSASITFTGSGNYTGTKIIRYTINKKPISLSGIQNYSFNATSPNTQSYENVANTFITNAKANIDYFSVDDSNIISLQRIDNGYIYYGMPKYSNETYDDYSLKRLYGSTYYVYITLNSNYTPIESYQQVILKNGSNSVSTYVLSSKIIYNTVRVSNSYYTMENVSSSATIVLTDYTYMIADKSLSGSLVVPYSLDNTSINSNSDKHPYANNVGNTSSYTMTYKENDIFVELEIGKGLTLSVSGTMAIGGKYGSAAGGCSGQTYGPHGNLKLNENSYIQVQNGGRLSSCGYIYGTGKIITKNGSYLYVPFVINDYKGGSNTAVSTQTLDRSPFNGYGIVNIQTDIKVEYGTNVIGYVAMYMNSDYQKTNVKFISSSGALFNLSQSDGYIYYKYDSSKEYTDSKDMKFGLNKFEIFGNASIASISMSISFGISITINTANIVLPIPANIHISQESGSLSINAKIIIQAGSQIHIKNGASLSIGSNYMLLVADCNHIQTLGGSAYDSKKTIYSVFETERGHLIIDGNMSVNGTFGGIIETNGSGNVSIANTATLSATYIDGGFKTDEFSILGGLKKWNLTDNNRTESTITARYVNENDQIVSLTSGEYIGINNNMHYLTSTTYKNYEGTTQTFTYHTNCGDIKGQFSSATNVSSITISYKDSDETTLLNSVDVSFVSSTNYRLYANAYSASKLGYSFDGWYYKEGNNNVDLIDYIDINTDITLYAKWTQKTYSIVYQFIDKDNPTTPYAADILAAAATANLSINNYTSLTLSTNATFSIVEFNHNSKDYKVLGFAVINNMSYEIVTSINSSNVNRFIELAEANEDTLIIYGYLAEYTAYTITYDLDGGTASNPTSYYVDTNTFTLNNPTKSGYTFIGWTGTGIDGSSMTVTITKGSTGNRSYTANWDLENYSISYDYAGGTAVNPVNYNATQVITLVNPVRTGYTFTGWTGTGIDGSTMVVTIAQGSTGARSYVAHWQANQYTIDYNGNGATSGTNYQVTVTYDSDKIATINASGHEFSNGSKPFVEWNTQANGTGTKYYPGDDVPATNLTLYAIWGYTVTYNANGGSVNPTSISVSPADSVTLPTPSRTGYTFNGWYTSSSGGTKVGNAGATYKPNGDITIYAQWTINSYKVTISTSNSTTTVTVGGTTISSGGSVEYNSVVKVVLSYSESEDRTFTIKQGNTNVTRYSDEACTNTTTSTSAGTYYFRMPAGDVTISSSSTSCLLPNTLVLMSDGSYKEVQYIVPGDELLVFNHETGRIETSFVTFNDYEEESLFTVINLHFTNNHSIGVIYEHGFFDLDLMTYVYITEGNYLDYIGHRFYGIDGEYILDDAYISEETVKVYSPITCNTFNYFTEGLLSMPGGIEGLFNYFDYDDSLKYDEDDYNWCIENIGLFTFEDLEFFGVSRETFDAYNAKYFKIAMAKGLLTEEMVYYYVNRYGHYFE